MTLRDPAFVLAVVWDALWGEPPTRAHPVAGLGQVIEALERRAPASPGARLVYGAAMTVGVAGLAATVGAATERLGPRSLPGLLARTYLWKSSFALRALGEAGKRMGAALQQGGAEAGRIHLGALCSRDPATLDIGGLAAATIESLAENASDSVVAPAVFGAWLGLPGALAYRAVNTLDAMIGYRTPAHRELGKAAARTDDLLNLIPARLTAAGLLVGGALEGTDVRRGLRTWLRDAARTPSPNAGRPIAVMAGLLGIELDKPGVYVLGRPGRRARIDDIERAWRIVAWGCGAAVLGVLGLEVLRGGR